MKDPGNEVEITLAQMCDKRMDICSDSTCTSHLHTIGGHIKIASMQYLSSVCMSLVSERSSQITKSGTISTSFLNVFFHIS